MPRFLSDEWVGQLNAALRDVDLTGTQGTGSLVAAGGRFTVGQIVTGGPEGPVSAVLTVDGGQVAMELTTGEPAADVTISLDYDDAAALSRGELDPGGALSTGRVRIRGDLSVLMAGQSVLAAAAHSLEGLSAQTTY